jgi:glycosyltransferase involved in cell wall biosynthesis
MNIAQIAPLMESVPPKLYGGTERIVSYLTEELVRLGHDVTLFASGDSVTSAKLVSCSQQALRLDGSVWDPLPHYMLMLDRVWRLAPNFDVLHFHIDHLHLPLFRPIAKRTVTTLHGRQDLPGLQALYREFGEMPLISISNAQRQPLPDVSFKATVYHGLPESLHQPSLTSTGKYLAFLGRISPEKGPDRAVKIARGAGMPLKIAAKVDRADQDYFREEISPLLQGADVEFVGEIGEGDKAKFLGDASALLFPIEWPEPFGIVMIEAMACGTPVLAFDYGSVREVIEDGVTGKIVRDVQEAVEVLPQVIAMDRRAIQRRFEERFSSRRMAKDYLDVYHSLVSKGADGEPATSGILMRPAVSSNPSPALASIEPVEPFSHAE